MNDELLKIVKKHLPEMAVKEFRSFIDEAEKQKEEIATLRSTLEVAKRNVKEQSDSAKNFKKLYDSVTDLEIELTMKDKELDDREASLVDREIRQDLFQAQYERQEAISRSNDIFRLTEIIFKNPIVKKTVIGETGINGSTNQYNNETSQYQETPTYGPVTKETIEEVE